MSRFSNRHSPRSNPLVFVGEMMRLGRVRQLSEKALEFMGKVVTEGVTDQGVPVATEHRITAARAIVQYSIWREQWEFDQGATSPEEQLAILTGSDENMLQWMDQARPRILARIEARIQARALAPPSFDPIEPRTGS